MTVFIITPFPWGRLVGEVVLVFGGGGERTVTSRGGQHHEERGGVRVLQTQK